MRTAGAVVAALAVSLAPFACRPGSAQEAKLVVRTEPPLANVRVEIPDQGLHGLTNASGRVAFIVPPFLTTVRVTTPRGEVFERSLRVEKYGSTLVLPVTAPAPTTGRLVVVKREGATVRLSGGRRSRAGSGGRAAFASLPAGSYDITVTANGGSARRSNVGVKAGSTTSISLALPEQRSPPPTDSGSLPLPAGGALSDSGDLVLQSRVAATVEPVQPPPVSLLSVVARCFRCSCCSRPGRSRHAHGTILSP